MSAPHQALGLVRGERNVRFLDRAPARDGPDRRRSGESHVLGLVSGKGGVGKTILAVNLTSALAGMGVRTLLIDGDAGLTNADLMLGRVPRFDLDDWVSGRAEMTDVVCRARGGPDLLLTGRGQESHLRLRAALAGGSGDALSELISSYELVVVDLGAGIGSALLDLACACDRVWLVGVPEPTSLADAYAITKQLLQRRGSVPIELVVNRVADRPEGERTHRALDRMTRRFLDRALPLRGLLPREAAADRSVARQIPFVVDARDSALARRVGLLAEALLEECRSAREAGHTPRSHSLPLAP